jgi:hypothetical protein
MIGGMDQNHSTLDDESLRWDRHRLKDGTVNWQHGQLHTFAPDLATDEPLGHWRIPVSMRMFVAINELVGSH